MFHFHKYFHRDIYDWHKVTCDCGKTKRVKRVFAYPQYMDLPPPDQMAKNIREKS